MVKEVPAASHLSLPLALSRYTHPGPLWMSHGSSGFAPSTHLPASSRGGFGNTHISPQHCLCTQSKSQIHNLVPSLSLQSPPCVSPPLLLQAPRLNTVHQQQESLAENKSRQQKSHQREKIDRIDYFKC